MEKYEQIIGARIELRKVEKRRNPQDDVRTYYSKVLDVAESDEGVVVSATMPIFEGHIIPLQVGSEYDVYFSTSKQIYVAECRILSRSKDINIYTMEMLMTTELSKVQRREYYRLPCEMGICLYKMTLDEVLVYENTHEMPARDEKDIYTATVIDISGGGIKMRSSEHYDKGEWMVINMALDYNGQHHDMQLAGRVISSYPVVNKRDLYETRIQFRENRKEIKELIVKYIFQEQRKARQKEREFE